MWDSTGDGHWGRGTVVDSYSMSYVLETRREPLESSVLCVKHVQEVGKEWCSLLYQRQLIGQAELEQIRFHGHECRKSIVSFSRTAHACLYADWNGLNS